FDSAVVSFGLRNTPDYRRVLSEMSRVTKPGGLVCCMDASTPDSPVVLPFFMLYFGHVMPLLGGGKEKMSDYIWLHESTEQFLSKEQLRTLFQRVGLKDVKYRSFMFGSCALHSGIKK
ncbi:MAG: class I SAM-dependent methyltransferase, partial [Clostridiales bacterium]|nr:class I SAM-dependent methyltransferase [Clostridiales bacterium]